MATYAHIITTSGVSPNSAGIVFELFEPPADMTMAAFWPAAMLWVDVSAVTPAPQPNWTATETDGVWAFTPPVAAPGPSLVVMAQAMLDQMDGPGGCAIRCFKAGVTFPVAWQTYCTALRSIVNGTATPAPTALPAQPAYPAGT